MKRHSTKAWYIISYDVREPKRLRRTEKKLKGYGERIQYSIFRCRLTERQLERLRWELSGIMEGEDSLLVVRLCARCSARMPWRNPPEDWPAERGSYEIL